MTLVLCDVCIVGIHWPNSPALLEYSAQPTGLDHYSEFLLDGHIVDPLVTELCCAGKVSVPLMYIYLHIHLYCVVVSLR